VGRPRRLRGLRRPFLSAFFEVNEILLLPRALGKNVLQQLQSARKSSNLPTSGKVLLPRLAARGGGGPVISPLLFEAIYTQYLSGWRTFFRVAMAQLSLTRPWLLSVNRA